MAHSNHITDPIRSILSDRRMVLLKATLVGALLLVAAVLLLSVAGPYFTIQVQNVQQHSVEPHAEFLVGDVTDRQYTLPGGVSVFGTVDVAQAPSNQSGSLQFMILDTQNYNLWSAGQPSNNLFASTQAGAINYTFNTASSGIYHFVFDNRASVYKKYVVLGVNYDEVSTGTKLDPKVPYVGWGLLVVGLVVLVYGILRKPTITWA